MTRSFPHRWLIEQQRLGHALCVVLDSENEHSVRQTLLKSRRPDQYLSIYAQTPVAELGDSGPFVFSVERPGDEPINEMLNRPDNHWGWLASLPQGGLPRLVEHWRERLIIGERPHQVLYRFHDNRVLARALKHLPVEAYPAYLGPALSVCYWQDTGWASTGNPAPGTYPVPDSPLWLQMPATPQQATQARLLNARRFLLAEHVQAFATLAEQQDPEMWLRATLDQAGAWHWQTPEQLEFLLTQGLQAPAYSRASYWQVRPAEKPDEHFERVRLMTAFCQGDAPL
ncbi:MULTISPECIES: DUF4123 domain-containing protein [unclassified Pseudomonas]|uniref:DUF4123 domain-containing protein n=1 Tax=unclassified Pseudomonas TaxID=196821 RepID=UPI000CD04CC2|nr:MULTISPECIES: DUF4123 domain-containing protein [unclassified Pseudomonas]POA13711.1 hypothetical protein C1892_14500 [Pseudomonas sp. MPBD7-1]